MHSRLLHLRLWLETHGLYPKGRLAFISWYFLGLDILLVLVQRVATVLHRPFGVYLSGWIVFLSLLTVVLFSVLIARRISSKLLWGLRNRLIVTYIFIGVIPLILLIALALGTFYLFAGQFATFIVSSKLQLELQDLAGRNEELARSVAREMDAGRRPADLPELTAEDSGL